MPNKWFEEDAENGKTLYDQMRKSNNGFAEMTEFQQHELLCYIIFHIEKIKGSNSKARTLELLNRIYMRLRASKELARRDQDTLYEIEDTLKEARKELTELAESIGFKLDKYIALFYSEEGI